jgi:hypothetical protein
VLIKKIDEVKRDEKEIKEEGKVVMKRREKTEKRKGRCYPRVEVDRGVPGL